MLSNQFVGTDLRRYLRSCGVLDVHSVVSIVRDAALLLGAVHQQNIVHGNVKPQNILLGQRGSIKMTGFGTASVYKDINATMSQGMVQYLAPELLQGEIITPATDIYALGIVMYEMLMGRTPFDGDTPEAVMKQHIQDVPSLPRQLNPSIPPGLEEIILCCLEKAPEKRFHDGSVLAEALSGFQSDYQTANS